MSVYEFVRKYIPVSNKVTIEQFEIYNPDPYSELLFEGVLEKLILDEELCNKLKNYNPYNVHVGNDRDLVIWCEKIKNEI